MHTFHYGIINDVYESVLLATVEASKAIMDVYNSGYARADQKSDGSFVTDADLTSAKIISEHLRLFGFPVVDEESPIVSYDERRSWDTLWLVDPLDGTSEFVKKTGEFVVNIALVHFNRPIFGVIASPVLKKILFGGTSFGVFICDFEHLSEREKWVSITKDNNNFACNSIVVIGSHTFGNNKENALVSQLKKHNDVTYIRRGSALKFFDLAQNNADIYPRFAPSMEWDIAAGQAILETLGGKVVDAYTRKTLTYNKTTLFNPDFIATTHHFPLSI